VKAWPKTVESIVAQTREFVRRHWQGLLRLRERLRFREEALHLALAGGVGVLGGITNRLFYACVEEAQGLAFHSKEDLAVIAATSLSPWARLAIPALGGSLAGLILYWGLRLVGRQGTGNLLEAVVAGDGRLPLRTALIKALSSLVSISSGASIGREGSITQMTATLASKLGQVARWQPYRLRMLVACGAAAGIAAAYNAPIAGAVFAAQIVLGNFSMNLFAPLVFASVVATMTSHSVFLIKPWYQVPNFVCGLWHLPWFVLLGLLAGGLAALFLKLLRQGETLFNRWPLPVHARLGLAGLFVGGIAYHLPEVWGNGYSVANRILDADFTLRALLLIFAAKLLTTVVTVGAGTVGGVFTPTLFLGAGLGGLFGMVLHAVQVAKDLSLGAFALVGMASVLAGTTHSPLLAMIMVFEISLNYSLMPPLMIACVMATMVARKLHPESVYTEPLRARGVPTERDSSKLGAATEQTVGDLMRAPIPPLRETIPLPEIAQRFLTSAYNFLPVVNAEQRLLGVVALHDLKEFLMAGQELRGIIAADVMRPPPACLTPDQKLLEALPTLLASELRNVPVVSSPKEFRLVGTVVKAEALGRLSEAIAVSTSTLEGDTGERRTDKTHFP
jgi:CIC family chloride channel protein